MQPYEFGLCRISSLHSSLGNSRLSSPFCIATLTPSQTVRHQRESKVHSSQQRFFMTNASHVLAMPGLIALWEFQEPSGSPRMAMGPHGCALQEGAGPVARVSPREGAPFGQYSADLNAGQFFRIPREECAALDLCGSDCQVSVVAWIQRHRKREVQCEVIAGMWDETRNQRQYGLFLDLRIHQAGDNVSGHVSATGGPTPDYPWAMDAAIGAGYLTYYDWHCVGFSYDGSLVTAWLDGRLESRVGFNPFAYPHGIHKAGANGADFTVGAVSRGGEMGNWFVGRIGGLAVFDRALFPQEHAALTALLPAIPAASPTKPPVLV